MWPFRKPEVVLLVLCTANICRSPAAEALLRQALKRLGLSRRVRVLSAGTAVGAPGAHPDPRMRSLAAEVGVPMRGMRAQPLTPALLESATVVYGMESAHLIAVEGVLPGYTGEVLLLDPEHIPIDDPYFGNKAGVRQVFERLALLAESRAEDWRQRLVTAARIGKQ